MHRGIAANRALSALRRKLLATHKKTPPVCTDGVSIHNNQTADYQPAVLAAAGAAAALWLLR